MRIGDDHVASLIESDPPQLVIVQDHDGQEIVLLKTEIKFLLRAIGYFGPHLGLGDGEMVEELLITRKPRVEPGKHEK